ncbi:MAG: hypothetical protein GX637_07120 [Clostridiales bacterium]|nr:hypothetical protein [Clostridiales bacterium]
MHRLPKRFFAFLLILAAALALALCSAQAAVRQKITLTYKMYIGNGKTASKNALKEMPADLILFFSPEYNTRYYFVIPQEWDPDDLRIYFTGAATLNIDGKRYSSGDKISLKLNESVTIKPPKGTQIHLTALQTGGLPTLFIKTKSGSIGKLHADKTYSEPGTLYMTDAQGQVEYDGELTAIRVRGNATLKYDKKPYQIKLKESASLAGMKKDKTYILLANALDRSQIRNTIALDLARYSGAFAYTPAAQSVNLYLNNDFKGTYLLTEKVEIDKSRLRITNLESALEQLNPDLNFSRLKPKGILEYKANAKKSYTIPNEPEDFTGGYLIQSNAETRYATEASGFVTKLGFPFTFQEPKYVTQTQLQYVFPLFQQIENALSSKSGVDPDTGKHYTQLLDLNTFVNRYVLAEVVDDYDGQRCYFYKDSDAVDATVYAGPVWDQDNILGAYERQCGPAEIHIASDTSKPYYWFTLATRQKDFQDAAIAAYRQIYRPAIDILLGKAEDPRGILKSIDEYAREVRVSGNLDLLRWPSSLRNTYAYINTKTGNDFDEQVNFLKNYLTKRQPALDKAFPAASPAALTPAPRPTAEPSAEPTNTPAAEDAAEPKETIAPSAAPTAEPTPEATATPRPAAKPTIAPGKLYSTTYKKYTVHPGVYPLRQRLHQLGYLDSLRKSSDERAYTYDDKMVAAVRDLQKKNGLERTGVATPELQALIYSDDVIALKTPPAPTPRPDVTAGAKGPSGTPELPALDEEGFLPAGSQEEFLFQDESDGLWYYISKDLYVEIRRYQQPKIPLVWFETRVRMRGGMAADTIFAEGKEDSEKEVNPTDIARDGKAVLAFSDDFYATRAKRSGFYPGIIIRNGKTLYNEEPRKPSILLFPRLDVMALFPDGSMDVYERGTVTLKELQSKGAVNTYSFGPVLIKYGQETITARYSPSSLHYGNEPRNAVGMLDKNDFLFLTVKGRSQTSNGVSIGWLVDRFLAEGVQTAFNLDGGGTSCIVFMGELLNKNGDGARGINSMIRFGTSDLVPEK